MSTAVASLDAVVDAAGRNRPLVRVSVVRADGSTPREAGAAMLVWVDEIRDTIGGGALELHAIAHARALLGEGAGHSPWHRETRDFALGPSLGQCCGGATRLLFELWTAMEAAALAQLLQGGGFLVLRPLVSGIAPVVLASRKESAVDVPLPVQRAARDMLAGARPRRALWVPSGRGAPAWFIEPAARATTLLYLYGAGHVGRAIVHVLQGLAFNIHWVDTAPERFPHPLPPHIQMIAAPDPATVATSAPAGAMHLVLTFSHAIDLAIVYALLQRADASFVGLIGSGTKAARFRKRLREGGISDQALARLTCPIGIGGLTGKEPPVIAVSVAAQLIGLLEADASRVPMPMAHGA